MIKRIIDILLSLLILLLVSPLFIAVALILRLTGEGEVIYKQGRIGYRNNDFKMWKFATMVKNSPNMLTGDVTLKDDPRVLPFGKWLRKTKINELPQLINVLKGDMSFVGARPIMKPSFDHYSDEAKQIIYNTRPGVTGIASLIFRDEESMIANSGEDPISFYQNKIIPYKNMLDIWYQNNRSLWVDFKILFLTGWAVLFPEHMQVDKYFNQLPKRNF
ncbi:MAG: sugar transferase [Saprospiraceae bacterium]|nr:sugar transferase [Saprospiraceae bacterium]